tara:strand:- start:1325 stop:1543 length:219 start_codon:yes stop_codon:yes gene_type:complete
MNLFKDQVQVDHTRLGKGSNTPPRKTDSKLFLCPKCRDTWEWQRQPNGTKRLLKYKHIPRYGKKEIICELCK